MEKRIGTLIIIVKDDTDVLLLNQIISKHASIIIGRQGIPLHDKGYNLISLIFEGTTDKIGSLTGQLGKLKGIHVKSAVLKEILE